MSYNPNAITCEIGLGGKVPFDSGFDVFRYATFGRFTLQVPPKNIDLELEYFFLNLILNECFIDLELIFNFGFVELQICLLNLEMGIQLIEIQQKLYKIGMQIEREEIGIQLNLEIIKNE